LREKRIIHVRRNGNRESMFPDNAEIVAEGLNQAKRK
jgi:hypothetical protein